MLLDKVCLILFSLSVSCDALTKVTFARCNFNGFTCMTNRLNNQDISYVCPSTATDVRIDINELSAPSNTESLTLKGCQKLTISTRCSNARTKMNNLLVLDIRHLVFQIEYETRLPPVVKLENVSYIETIPPSTFAQVDRSIPSKCSFITTEFSELYMRNVFIDTIMTNAFVMPNKFQRVSFSNVTVNRLQSNAIKVGLLANGTFHFEDSKVDMVEHLGFQIKGNVVTFQRNSFVDIASSAINGTITNFTFIHNVVNTMQPHSISILSKNVNISSNNIEFLQSGAFDKIGPGLLMDSGFNFGKLRFNYAFTKNKITNLHAGCLQPDMVAYDNVANEFNVIQNQFFCTCPNFGWMFSKLGYGYNTEANAGFYDNLLEKQNQNTCFNTACSASISTVENTLVNGVCREDHYSRINDPCNNNTQTATTTIAHPTNKNDQRSNRNRPANPFFRNSGDKIRSLFFSVFITILTLCITFE